MAALGWGLLRIAVPALTGLTIDRAITPHNHAVLIELVLAIVILAGFQAACAGTRRYWALRTSYRVEADLRSALTTA